MIKPDLNITLLQSELHWENISENLKMFSEKISALKEATDLIILPEMFTTGFSMNTSLAEDMNGQSVNWMKQISAEKNAVVCGSIMIKEGNQYFNCLVWMKPDGNFEYYNKRHLFSLGDEHKNFTAGTQKIIVEWKGWKFLPLICYDLRFPVWCRNTSSEYDVLLFVANWPARRITAWKSLLPARSIENQCYTIGLSRVGTDDNGIYHSGDSMVVDPLGEILWQGDSQPAIHTCTLSFHPLKHVRETLSFLKDGDAFELK